MRTLSKSFELFKQILPKNLPILLFWFLFLELTQQHFINQLTLAEMAQNDMARIVAMLGKSLASLTEYVFFSMFVALRVMEIEENRPHQTFSQFMRKYIGALTAEGLRSLGIILLWSLALILPGLFKYIRLSFVPYVVMADPKYDAGERDALEYSNDLIKGFTVQLFLIYLAAFAIETTRDEVRTNLPLLQFPAQTLFVGAAFFLFSFYVNILLFKIYQLRVNVHATQMATKQKT